MIYVYKNIREVPMKRKPKEPNQHEKFVILKSRFVDSGRTPSAYARVKELDRQTIIHVLNAQRNGRNETKQGKSRAVFEQLKKDKLWTWKFPWEESEWVIRRDG